MTEAFTAETTIDGPVDAVWARLIDWDTATQWMSGVDALRAEWSDRRWHNPGVHDAG